MCVDLNSWQGTVFVVCIIVFVAANVIAKFRRKW